MTDVTKGFGGKRLEIVLAEKIASFRKDPLGYVMWNFPWKDDPSIQKVKLVSPWKERFPDYEYGPDAWACKFLDDLGDEIKQRNFNFKDPVVPIRFSTASGHGIGKSTLVSWLILFIADTRPYSMGVVTANTAEQLRTKTWAELSKWLYRARTKHLWNYSNSKGHMALSRIGTGDIPQKWRCDAHTARAENSEAFQGLHAADSTPYYIFDEASGIEDLIWEARFGGGTDGEPMSFDFGNPTRKTGYFYENTAGRYKHRYITRQIDSRSVAITNKAYFEQLAQDWGEDSDLFKVKVKGEFPSISSLQFIDSELVDEAMRRRASHDKSDPVILGVDCARFGDNDSVIFPRIGMDARSFGIRRFNRLDTTQLVDRVIEVVHEFRALGKQVSVIAVDGGGLGAGPVDQLRRLGYNPVDVNFGGKSSDPRYHRKGDQMWGNLRDALQRLALPDNEDLRSQLTQREYDIPGGKIKLESKKDMADRNVQSPDIADALALTFAVHANPNFKSQFDSVRQFVKHEYDPFE